MSAPDPLIRSWVSRPSLTGKKCLISDQRRLNDDTGEEEEESGDLIKKQRSATAPTQPTTSKGDETETPYETIRIDNLIQHCSCIICLELPRADQSVYQCTNGHICCSGNNFHIYCLHHY